jgi:hypothetical protein
VVSSPEISKTVTPPSALSTTRPEPETTIAVWPPAQSRSTQIAANGLFPKPPPPDTADAKWSALPPIVTPVMEVLLPNELMQTTKQLWAVVDGMVTERALALVVLTTEMAMRHRSG